MNKQLIIGNYGDESLSLLQWCIEQKLQNIEFISVDTGWSADFWEDRVNKAQLYASSCGVNVVRLKAKSSFKELVLEQKRFPNLKFQWCAGFLKGLVINDYLDQIDASCEATILLAKRASVSRINSYLDEFVKESEYYNERCIWHPMLKVSDKERDLLIQRAGFEVLAHRSLECLPCIHSNYADLEIISKQDLLKVVSLEQELGSSMFQGTEGIEDCIDGLSKNSHLASLRQFDMGCGGPWGCGE